MRRTGGWAEHERSTLRPRGATRRVKGLWHGERPSGGAPLNGPPPSATIGVATQPRVKSMEDAEIARLLISEGRSAATAGRCSAA